MSLMIMILFLFLKLATSNNMQDADFIFNGYVFQEDGNAELNSNGLFTLTNSTRQQMGHVFYNFPLQFKNSTNGSVFSFSTTFIFAILSEYPELGGHGLALVISPSKGLPGSLPSQYLGIFSNTNNGESTNRIIAVELDTILSPEFDDINDNHVGIDINGLKSIKSAPAAYFNNKNGSFNNLSLTSGDPMQVWVEYNGMKKELNVTLTPIDIPKPDIPLLSLKQDLSPFINEYMYVGFSSSTGSIHASHCILGWSFKMNGQAREIDQFHLPKLPWSGHGKEEHGKLKKILAVLLSLTGVIVLLIVIFGALLVSRKKKFMEVLEDWEVQYGPYRFNYKDLFIATKGFKNKELLGEGGFGQVYRGVLPLSNIQVAMKRVAHDSRQGMREFVAEIATIGRLRNPNLVRLLGYCRRKRELLLVYDFMPNGSLDKFLYCQHNCMLNWTQRFKIIKDVALGLLYLRQQWAQVVIHRDIKASNVLIDSEMNGRLGDFGLAKLCDHGTDPQTSHVAGTLGYIAPELARTGKANTSTDLFAFGAFMLVVVCGRRPVLPRASPEEIILVDWVAECWERGAILETVDRRLGNEYVVEEVELVLKLGLLCSHVVAAARPSMSSVVQYLEGDAQLPDNLSAIIQSRDFDEGPNESGAPLDQPSETISVSSLTITESFISRGR